MSHGHPARLYFQFLHCRLPFYVFFLVCCTNQLQFLHRIAILTVQGRWRCSTFGYSSRKESHFNHLVAFTDDNFAVLLLADRKLILFKRVNLDQNFEKPELSWSFLLYHFCERRNDRLSWPHPALSNPRQLKRGINTRCQCCPLPSFGRWMRGPQEGALKVSKTIFSNWTWEQGVAMY